MSYCLKCLSMPFLFLFLLSSCAEPLKLKTLSEGSSFIVSKNEDDTLTTVPSSYIAIKKTALGKEHLLQGSMIVQAVVGRFNNLKSRVVVFKKADNSIYMFEATDGHTITHDIAQEFVLAQFPIVKEQDDVYYFDFAAGMAKIFVNPDWNAHDFDGKEYKENSWDAIGLEVSYLKTAKIDENDGLMIRQIAQAKSIEPSRTSKTPVEVRYYLTPYKENKNFKPTESKHFKKMGFFELAPRLKLGGEQVIYASKFDLNKPIIFAVSANTPEEYRNAVKEGALYWNKAFGSEVIKVIDAPEGVSAPNFKYNIIQWVDWKTAGFAYADAQMDPRTGEILHAQIFMTSVFAFHSKKRAKALLERLTNNQNQGHHHSHKSLDHQQKAFENFGQKKIQSQGIDGIERQVLCHYEPSQSMINSLTKLVNSEDEFSDETYLKISQDYVRETVAHEVGHTLGLRHNFAGSLYANFDVTQLPGFFLEYARAGKAPEHIRTSSSVMEYQSFSEGVITGDQIRSKSEPLDYDKKVIQSLYFGKIFTREELPPFCTDSHNGKYVDCQTFDFGRSVFKNAVFEEESIKDNIPHLLLQNFVKGKEKVLKGELMTLGEATPSPLDYSVTTLFGRKRVLEAFKKDSQFLEVERQFPYLNGTTAEDLRQANLEYITAGVSEAGGMNHLFKGLKTEEVTKMKKTFNKLVDNYNEKEGLEGKYFEPEEIFMMKMQGEKFFKQYEESHYLSEITLLNLAKDLRVGTIASDFLKVVENKASNTILQEKGSKELNFEDKTYKLPVFQYPHDVRVKGTELLKSKAEDDRIWGDNAKSNIKSKLEAKLKEVLGEKHSDVKTTDLPDELARWVKENREIVNKLS